MSSKEVPSITKSSNLPSISPCTPMTTNVMVIVTKGFNMHWPKLLIVSLEWKNSLTWRSKGRTIVTLIATENSMVHTESPLSYSNLALIEKISNLRKLHVLINLDYVVIKAPLILTMIVVVPTGSMTFAWR